MQIGKVTGLHIVFLLVAADFLMVPLVIHLGGAWNLDEGTRTTVGMTVQWLPILAAFLFFAPLNRKVHEYLGVAIPANRRNEVLAVALIKPLSFFAVIGGVAAVHFLLWGPDSVVQWVRLSAPGADRIDREFRLFDMTAHFLVGVLIGPILEEILFRGFLYETWARRWGWIASMFMTAGVFAAFHYPSNVYGTFVASLVYTALYRRTGTLVAPILVHMFHNFAVWMPFLGQYMFPSGPAGATEIWTGHFVALTAAVVLVPTYVFMARDSAISLQRGDSNVPDSLSR